ncbi:MAG: hypothetical protein WC661_22120 [Opitutaceae bacterium]|jgi:hypothetical protein
MSTPPVTTLLEWIEMMREIIQRTGQAVRAGAGDWIEAQSINHPDNWHPLNPPGGSVYFHSTKARDEALKRIQTP